MSDGSITIEMIQRLFQQTMEGVPAEALTLPKGYRMSQKMQDRMMAHGLIMTTAGSTLPFLLAPKFGITIEIDNDLADDEIKEIEPEPEPEPKPFSLADLKSSLDEIAGMFPVRSRAYRCSKRTFKTLLLSIDSTYDVEAVYAMSGFNVKIYPDPLMLEDGKFIPMPEEQL